LKKTINHDSSIKMGSNNIFGGDSAIGENAKIIKNQNINVNSVTYDIDKEDVAFVEKASMLILNKYGDNKITWGGAISLIAGLITIFDGFGSILDRSNGFSWMPGWIPTAPREFGNYVIIIGFILIVVGGFLLSLVRYKHDSQCPACKRFYALKEMGEPKGRDVKLIDGIRRTIIRTYRCRYDDCGYVAPKKRNIHLT